MALIVIYICVRVKHVFCQGSNILIFFSIKKKLNSIGTLLLEICTEDIKGGLYTLILKADVETFIEDQEMDVVIVGFFKTRPKP